MTVAVYSAHRLGIVAWIPTSVKDDTAIGRDLKSMMEMRLQKVSYQIDAQRAGSGGNQKEGSSGLAVEPFN